MGRGPSDSGKDEGSFGSRPLLSAFTWHSSCVRASVSKFLLFIMIPVILD